MFREGINKNLIVTVFIINSRGKGVQEKIKYRTSNITFYLFIDISTFILGIFINIWI